MEPTQNHKISFLEQDQDAAQGESQPGNIVSINGKTLHYAKFPLYVFTELTSYQTVVCQTPLVPNTSGRYRHTVQKETDGRPCTGVRNKKEDN